MNVKLVDCRTSKLHGEGKERELVETLEERETTELSEHLQRAGETRKAMCFGVQEQWEIQLVQ